jgi:hypothetical protein
MDQSQTTSADNLSNPTNDEGQKKGCLNSLFKTAIWIIGIFVAIIILGILLEDPYPKSKDEMVLFLTNKCWKNDEIEVNSITINGTSIPKPSSNIREKLSKTLSVSNYNNEFIWQTFENNCQKLIADNYQFMFFRQALNDKFNLYEQSTNSELNSPTYEFNNVDIRLIDEKYQFNIKDVYSEYTFDDKSVKSDFDFESQFAKIIGLSKDMLKIEITSKAKINGDFYSITTTTKYKVISDAVINTKNLKRVIEKYDSEGEGFLY